MLANQKLIAPNLTPYKDDGTPDTELYIRHAKELLRKGCDMLAPFGTTGEAASLGINERMALLEALIGSGIEPQKLIPGTGLTSAEDTLSLSQHAMDLGVAAVMTLPPFYYKDVSDEGIFRYFARLIESAGNSSLRIYLYHIPPVAKVGFSIELVRSLVKHFPDCIIGIKDSGGEWENTKVLLEEFPEIAVYPGNELRLCRALHAGAAGCITATANINSVTIKQLAVNYEHKDAHHLEAWVDRFRKTIQPYGPIPAMKALLAIKDSTASWSNVRPPLLALDQNRAGSLAQDLKIQIEELPAHLANFRE